MGDEQRKNERINFIQLALTLCVNDENMRCNAIWNVLNECYPSKQMANWGKMHSDDTNKEKTTLPLKKEKNVTVSLRIGDDGNSLPLFIGKNGKNLKFIERESGIAAVHTSWLIGEQHNESKHDSITLKGTQAQIENALRASTVILERIGKWYDKRKLSLLRTALKATSGIEHDLETL